MVVKFFHFLVNVRIRIVWYGNERCGKSGERCLRVAAYRVVEDGQRGGSCLGDALGLGWSGSCRGRWGSFRGTTAFGLAAKLDGTIADYQGGGVGAEVDVERERTRHGEEGGDREDGLVVMHFFWWL